MQNDCILITNKRRVIAVIDFFNSFNKNKFSNFRLGKTESRRTVTVAFEGQLRSINEKEKVIVIVTIYD